MLYGTATAGWWPSMHRTFTRNFRESTHCQSLHFFFAHTLPTKASSRILIGILTGWRLAAGISHILKVWRRITPTFLPLNCIWPTKVLTIFKWIYLSKALACMKFFLYKQKMTFIKETDTIGHIVVWTFYTSYIDHFDLCEWIFSCGALKHPKLLPNHYSVCFRTQLPVHLRFSLFYKGMPVWFNTLKTQVIKNSFIYIPGWVFTWCLLGYSVRMFEYTVRIFWSNEGRFLYVFSSIPRKLYTIFQPTFSPIKRYQDSIFKLLTSSTNSVTNVVHTAYFQIQARSSPLKILWQSLYSK